MVAILAFSLIAGLENVYPHYFLSSGDPAGDVVIEKNKVFLNT